MDTPKRLKRRMLAPLIGLIAASIPITALSQSYPGYGPHSGYMGGHMGYFGGWVMAVIVVFLVADLILGAAALIKYLFKK